MLIHRTVAMVPATGSDHYLRWRGSKQSPIMKYVCQLKLHLPVISATVVKSRDIIDTSYKNVLKSMHPSFLKHTTPCFHIFSSLLSVGMTGSGQAKVPFPLLAANENACKGFTISACDLVEYFCQGRGWQAEQILSGHRSYLFTFHTCFL